jgi:large subunit ribosomal protein L21
MSCLCSLRSTLSRTLQQTRTYASSANLPSSSAVELLKSQPSHYVVAQLHQRLYLLTPNDLLTVPRINDLKVGDKIRLSRILEVGSRDFTLKAAATPKLAERAVLSDQEVQVYATVEEHTKGKMQRIEKFKRRHRYHRLLKHKGKYTRLRVNEITLGSMEGVQQGVEKAL